MSDVRSEAAKYFDEAFYLTTYAGVAEAGTNALDHYLETGWKEGNDPSPDFSTDYYLNLYPDVRGLDMNPLVHYALFGHAEGRSPKKGVLIVSRAASARQRIDQALRAEFDEEFYLKSYPEVRRSGLSALDHFMDAGWQRGYNPSRGFDTKFYLKTYADVRGSGINPFFHYIAFGRAEGRHPKPGLELLKKAPPAAKPADAPPKHVLDLQLIGGSGVFDPQYYASTYPDLAGMAKDKLLEHYYFNGWREGRNPCFYFNTNWYLQQSGLKADGVVNPLVHYLETGEAAGRQPVPWFRPAWYAQTYDVDLKTQKALQHFMQTGRGNHLNPNPYFDCQYYIASNPDSRTGGLEPYVHYFTRGFLARRNPGGNFNAAYYAERYKLASSEDPLVHFLQVGEARAFRISRNQPASAGDIYQTVQKFTAPSEDCEERDAAIPLGRKARAKAIAFYLPQFHPIPQNDKAWGKGFTEWRNTVRGLPRFTSHYQPRIPQELGYYDLVQSDILRQQIEMAKQAGLAGFCYYYYWFNGTRVLEKPVDKFLADASLDMPFAVMYANENWTRRWDGLDDDIVLHQDYRPEDEEPLLADLNRHFADPRYIRIDGRPLFIIYRPGIIPDALDTIARWRSIWHSKFGVAPLILMVQGFGDNDPGVYGLDGAVEFPPHKIGAGLDSIIETVDLLDGAFAKQGMVLSYEELAKRSHAVPPPAFPLLRGVVPSWDNEARRRGTGVVYHGSTPEKYERWLRQASHYAARHPAFGESFVFINAWNEWAEAAYLEPDVHYGAAYLNATARALTSNRRRAQKDKIVVVSHDAHPHGAQLLALNIAMTLTRQFGTEAVILVLGHGPLMAKFAEVAEVIQMTPEDARLAGVIKALARRGFNAAIVNTTVSGRAIPHLKSCGFRIVSLIHELPRLIKDYKLEPMVDVIAEHSNRVVFAARQVKDGFAGLAKTFDEGKALIRPQGHFTAWNSDPAESHALRQRLGISQSGKLILNVAYADARKGFDIFLSIARAAIAAGRNLHFLWVGTLTPDVQNWLIGDIAESPEFAARFHLLPFTDKLVPIYEAADLFLLSSREDPFPTVVLDALRAGLPVVAFHGSGGAVELVAEHGRLTDRSDIAGTLAAIDELLAQPGDERIRRAQARRAEIEKGFRFDDYVFDLAAVLELDNRKVSVVVPNYNYANYVTARLDSIYDQTYPLFEVIVLDDKSADDSVEQLEAYAFRTARVFALEVNAVNSGSGYRQWDKGDQMARGEYVWMAEADDLCDPRFLDRAISMLDNSDAAFVFCDSRQIDENDTLLAENYQYYYKDLGEGALTRDFIMDGKEFVKRFLSVKNVILNVSSVVWRREALLHGLAATRADHLTMRLACDWKIYVTAALECGPVGFVAEPLNTHRRHSHSVIHASKADQHYGEIAAVQDFVAARVELDEATLVQREAYRKEVKEQLERQAEPVKARAGRETPGGSVAAEIVTPEPPKGGGRRKMKA